MQISISGTYYFLADANFRNIQQQDVYLLCDTSQAPVIVNLPPIAAFGGFLNVKLYISDASNNASVNSITINANSDNTINMGSSIVMNSNQCSCMVEIISPTSWMMVSDSSTESFLSANDSIGLIIALG